jgi:ubiquinone/menaquinone biosynthesis C-methylase UbiE
MSDCTTIPVEERLRAFRARSRQYLALGHDRLAAARFVVDAAGAPRGPALDVGTGKGLLAIALAQRDLEVVTIDVDASERELARLLADEAGVGARITFATGDAARLPWPDGGFACVAMMDVLHHLAEPGPVLREMARVTAPDGIIVLADFDEEGFDLVSRIHRAEGREHLRTSVTVAAAREELRRLGLAQVAQTRGHQHEIAVLRQQESGQGPSNP